MPPGQNTLFPDFNSVGMEWVSGLGPAAKGARVEERVPAAAVLPAALPAALAEGAEASKAAPAEPARGTTLDNIQAHSKIHHLRLYLTVV